MAGVIINKEEPGLLSRALEMLAGGAINDMFARTAEARQIENGRKIAADKAAAEEAARARQQEALQGLDFERGNPEMNARAYGTANIHGITLPNMSDLMPNYDTSYSNMGGFQRRDVTDPQTGNIINRSQQELTLSPDTKYQGEVSMRNTDANNATSTANNKRSVGATYAGIAARGGASGAQSQSQNAMLRALEFLAPADPYTGERNIEPGSEAWDIQNLLLNSFGVGGDKSVAGSANTQDFSAGGGQPAAPEPAPAQPKKYLTEAQVNELLYPSKEGDKAYTIEELQAKGYEIPPQFLYNFEQSNFAPSTFMPGQWQ